MNSETWIIFHAEPEQPGWEDRKLPMGGLTDILEEQLDYTEKGSIPQVGDRLRQFLHIAEFASERFPDSSTHVRDGDWVVTRVERYLPNSPNSSKGEIVVCYCAFDPIVSQREPLGRALPAGAAQKASAIAS